MRISAVIVGRNDNYGGKLIERATYCLNTMVLTFDEVIYVDWNTKGPKILTDEIDIRTNPERLQIIKVSPAMCKELTGTENDKLCEVLARNIGIRRATGDVIVSTNIDIIPPKREYLDTLLGTNDFITIAKHDLRVEDFGSDKNYEQIRDILPIQYGLNPIASRLIIKSLVMNKEILKQLPKQAHHTASSLICACGDFQIAPKELWYTIRGFEESMTKRLYSDTIVQYKAILSGATVCATNFPPVYHLDHERNNAPDLLNPEIPDDVGSNPETWGFSDVNLPLVLYKRVP